MQLNPTTVITGCNSGIGYYTALKLAQDGHHIVMLARDSNKSKVAFEKIKQNSLHETVDFIPVDLSLISSVRNAIDKIKSSHAKIDCLINNAGLLSRNQVITSEGHELTIAVNYLAPVLLAEQLAPLMKTAEDPRIIYVSSALYKKGIVPFGNWHRDNNYNGTNAYSNTKMMLVMHGLDFAEKMNPHNVSVNSLHPGVIATDVFREFPTIIRKPLMLFLTSPEKGAEPTLKLVLDPNLKGITGQFFYKKSSQKILPYALDLENRKKLAEQTSVWLSLHEAA